MPATGSSARTAALSTSRSGFVRRRASGSPFTDDQKKDWPKEVEVDQPFCHFEPHISVAFTGYKEGKSSSKETGQKVFIKNNATITHNTKYKGDPATCRART